MTVLETLEHHREKVTYAIVPRRLVGSETCVAWRRATWEARLDQLDEFLDAMDREERLP